MSALATLSGPVCARCSHGSGAARVQVRHGSVADIRACWGPAPVVPVVDMVVPVEVPAPAPAPVALPTIKAGSVWVSASGSLVRVRKARGGPHLLASERVGSDEVGFWDYRGAASRVIRELACVPASPARVAEFGHRSKSCVFCGKQLDDERSLRAGYGETCAGNHGLPWG